MTKLADVHITDKQYKALRDAEHPHSNYNDMRLALIEDYVEPSDFAYINPEGGYTIDGSAYIHAERCGFNWEEHK